ncbi:MAG: cytochrome c biogenesis protein ResB [Planctomycetota bacterium]|jgi:hypothetical protein
MVKIRRITLYGVLAAIVVLIVLSIVGAFIGAARAKIFFNSAPAAVYWVLFLLLLVAGMFIFPRLLKKPALLLIHLGCILILLGGLWGSEAGHEFQWSVKSLLGKILEKDFGSRKIPSGMMQIYEGQTENRVFSPETAEIIGELDFSIRLEDFSMEVYPAETEQLPLLYILMPDEQAYQVDVVTDREIVVPGTDHKIRIVKAFERFRMDVTDEGRQAFDAEDGPANPALEIEIIMADGTVETNYVFAMHSGMSRNSLGVRFVYELPQGGGMPKDYFSELTVFDGGKPTKTKTIEVNSPLYYKGYHFYQHSYDAANQQYTVLSVTSDSGLYAVFTGYALMSLGVMWQCWFISARRGKERS